MALGRVRPRFSLQIDHSAEEGIARIESAVARADSRSVSRTLGEHVDIAIDRSERHRWSPCVQLEFEQQEEGTVVYGLIGPHPNMWTLFAFFYITIATATLFGTVFGFVQMTLDEHAWGLWTFPAGLLLCVVMYAVSQLGQRIAAEQTSHLHQLVRGALGAGTVPEQSSSEACGDR